ncbi:hypothetical protein RJ640_025680 [Escallonia rubra]|uniref:Chlororespiratory reduction 4 n=1 Tax=Escallonia rubra TaxID=112253 RepID=A0AA88S285_9ASTE|nr:hypothetical protein RJ640_025680 [Escallonia rubra]
MVRLPQLSANRIYPAKSFNNLNFASNPTKQQCPSLLKSNAILRFRALSQLHFATDSKTCVPLSWNSLIRGFATSKGESQREAIWAFIAMRRSEAIPNELTYPFLFKACAALLALEEGRQVQSDVLKRGLGSNIYVQNTLIHFYGSCSKTVDARLVFDEMLIRTVVSWNSIISACVESSQFCDAVGLLGNMRDGGHEPDETTMVILLSACAELGNLSLGRWIHSQVIEKGLIVNCKLGTALVDMYAKCGAVDYASLVFHRMPERNVWTWSTMILGHAGLVEDGKRFFDEMKHVHGIKPMMLHYGAMVDVLGRASCLEEAFAFVMNMPIEPDAIVWRTLLNCCNIHAKNDYDGVGEKARKRLLELEPRRSGNFLMVANKYAEVGMWAQAAHVRNGMRDMGLKKMAGESCIEVHGSILRFVSGDSFQLNRDGILLLLDGLNLHMKLVEYELSSFVIL